MGLIQSGARTVLGMNVLFLLLLGFSFLFMGPDANARVIAQLTLVPVVLGIVASVAVLYTGWEPFE